MITVSLGVLLEEKNMSQSELARITQIRPSTVSDLFNNNSNFIKLEHINRICATLRCGVEQLLKLS